MTSETDYKRMFREALRIRLVEERIVALYPSDVIQSPVHLSIGQEAVAVGVCAGLRPCDLLFGNYRGHAYYLAKGGDLKSFFAELFGRANGFAGGKAGSMHLAAPEVGFQGCSAVVASNVPHAVGAALAARRLGKDQRIVVVFGDGATEEGVFHESLNFAALHRLPVVFVCENNGLAVHSSQKARQAYAIADVAGLYRIPYRKIEEGYDFVAAADAFAEVLGGLDGPRFVEIATYRSKEHVGVADDFAAGYRGRDAFLAWQEKDPLVRDAALAAELRAGIEAEIDAAVAFAEASPLPPAAAVLTDVI
jgi:TPP-dependent pyruvate/acetoin dehydrogenase alpha subunit